MTCIDGRAQQPIVDYLKRVHSVETVDLVTAVVQRLDAATVQRLKSFD